MSLLRLQLALMLCHVRWHRATQMVQPLSLWYLLILVLMPIGFLKLLFWPNQGLIENPKAVKAFCKDYWSKQNARLYY